jgi:polyphosphate kinase 2 (PPK2 family)
MGRKTERYRIQPGDRRLDRPADDTDGFDGDKAAAKELIEEQSAKLFDLQQLLFADNTRKVLVVLQGMDTSGKDGTIKHVFQMVNPLGVKVANFKRPNDVELEHDYLWRVHHNTPGNGDLTIFNRSHYEDVLVVRVHGLVPESTWKKRYEHIRNFEQMLADEGTVIRKFFLHISKDKQRDVCRSGSHPREELEVRARRPRGAQVLGRLHGLRGGAVPHVDEGRALVRLPSDGSGTGTCWCRRSSWTLESLD